MAGAADVVGGDGLGHVLGSTQFRPAFRTSTTGADLAVALYVLGKMSIRRGWTLYLIVHVTKAGACRLSCHGFTHVDSHIEELRIKANVFPSTPSRRVPYLLFCWSLI